MKQTIRSIPMVLVPIVPGHFESIDLGGVFDFVWPQVNLDQAFMVSSFPLLDPLEAREDVTYKIQVHAHLQQYDNEIFCTPQLTNILPHGIFSTLDDSVNFLQEAPGHIISAERGNIRGCLDNPCEDGLSTVDLIVPKDQWNALRETQSTITLRLLFFVDQNSIPFIICTGGNTLDVSLSFRDADIIENFVPDPGPVFSRWRSYEKVRDDEGNMVFVWGEQVIDPRTGAFQVRLQTTPNQQFWHNGVGFGPKEPIGGWPGDVSTVAPVPFTYRPKIIRFASAGPRTLE